MLSNYASQVSKINVNMPEISIADIAVSTARYRGIQRRVKIAEFKSLRFYITIPEVKTT